MKIWKKAISFQAVLAFDLATIRDGAEFYTN